MLAIKLISQRKELGNLRSGNIAYRKWLQVVWNLVLGVYIGKMHLVPKGKLVSEGRRLCCQLS